MCLRLHVVLTQAPLWRRIHTIHQSEMENVSQWTMWWSRACHSHGLQHMTCCSKCGMSWNKWSLCRGSTLWIIQQQQIVFGKIQRRRIMNKLLEWLQWSCRAGSVSKCCTLWTSRKNLTCASHWPISATPFATNCSLWFSIGQMPLNIPAVHCYTNHRTR